VLLRTNLKSSANVFRANKVHKGLPAIRAEQNDGVPMGCSSLHSRRSRGHAGDGQSGRGRPFFQEPSDGRRRDMSLHYVSIDLGGVAGREIGRHA
jgi:hypothetical protein